MSQKFNFLTHTFASQEDEEQARLEMCKYVYPADQSIERLKQSLSDPNLSSLIRIGDIEASFLGLLFDTTPEEREAIESRLWWCGINPKITKHPKYFAEIIGRAGIGMIAHPSMGPAHVWGGVYSSLSQLGLLSTKQWMEVHSIYYSVHDGTLFKSLTGKKVCLIGGKVDLFHSYFYLNEDYRRTFPFLGLENFSIDLLITTPDLPLSCMQHYDNILEVINRSIHSGIDAYLISCGMLGKFLAVVLNEQTGKPCIDIGNVLEIMMGFKKDRQWLCGPFLSYEHPNFKFDLTPRDVSRTISIRRPENITN